MIETVHELLPLQSGYKKVSVGQNHYSSPGSTKNLAQNKGKPHALT